MLAKRCEVRRKDDVSGLLRRDERSLRLQLGCDERNARVLKGRGWVSHDFLGPFESLRKPTSAVMRCMPVVVKELRR